MISIGPGDRVRTKGDGQAGVVLRLYKTRTALLAYVRLDARPTRDGQAFDVADLEPCQRDATSP
jgi:hypothetical protein